MLSQLMALHCYAQASDGSGPAQVIDAVAKALKELISRLKQN